MSGKAKGIKGAAAAGGVLVAACAVCCAPLIIPPVVALLAASGVGLALVGQIGMGLAALVGVAIYVVLRRRAVPNRETKSGCGCGPVSTCSSVHAAKRA